LVLTQHILCIHSSAYSVWNWSYR